MCVCFALRRGSQVVVVCGIGMSVTKFSCLLDWCFLFLLLGGVLANGSEVLITRSINCGLEFQYSESLDGFHLWINQKLVDSVSFCEAIELYLGCFLWDSTYEIEWKRIEGRVCSRIFSQAALLESSLLRGRKLLIRSPGSSKIGEPKADYHSGVPFGNIPIATPMALLLCCAFICTCFPSKRKELEEEVVQPKHLYSMDSVSSLDLNTRSERLPRTSLQAPLSPLRPPRSPLRAPPSPLRAPPSPLRIPPSPLRVPPSPSRFSMSPQLSRARSVHLTIDQIMKATQNFSPSCVIGEGGFGTIYKAELPNGQIVAVKRARKEDFASLQSEFSNEVGLLSNLEHRSLVRLLGCIDKGKERIIITEYVPNGTLREHLDGKHGTILDFSQRLEISIDVAHALTYLHVYAEGTIIHRDVKSSNILLTESFKAKVADFGFAKAGDEKKSHIITSVKGTAGYVDPEYLKTYQLTPKSDVFSFGILLLEIISGRRPVEMKRSGDEKITVRWAFKKYTEGNLSEVLDPMLEEVVDEEILEKMLSLAFQCAAPTRHDRPTMKETVEKLWEIRRTYSTLRRV